MALLAEARAPRKALLPSQAVYPGSPGIYLGSSATSTACEVGHTSLMWVFGEALQRTLAFRSGRPVEGS